jgi:IS5 family transposase
LKNNNFGRGDTPSVEQILRAGVYKEIKGLTYRELEEAQFDSNMFAYFVKVDYRKKPYSYQVYQKYISRIKVDTLKGIMIALNKIAVEEGIEDLSQFCEDSAVIETDIHYPTNNSLVWDCLKTSQKLLEQLKEEVITLEIPEYRKEAKKTYFAINVTKNTDERLQLFQKQLKTLLFAMEEVTKVVKKKSEYGINLRAAVICLDLEKLLPLMEKVFKMTYRKEIQGENVPVDEKLFSIYELHTDLIVKGHRDMKFGHKVNLGTGKSNLILACEIVSGNPCDTALFKKAVEDYHDDYGRYPESIATDGGYASLENRNWAKAKEGVKNIVFNKVVGSLKSFAESIDIEIKLKKWRSAIEAVISNLKRGFDIRRCIWKGWQHFQQKVYWSIIGYNIRVMTAAYMVHIPSL